MHKHWIIFPALALIGLIGYTQIARAHGGDMKNDLKSSLAAQLGVSEEQVETAISVIHDKRRDEMQTRQDNRLQALVDEGKLTSAQKEALVIKLSEMREEHEKLRTEFETWASANGIDLDAIGPMGMKSKIRE